MKHERRAAFRDFVDREVAPFANTWDQQERVPREVIDKLAAAGYLGAIEFDLRTLGVLHEEIGRGCSSLRSLLTVHSMVTYSIQRWGSAAQKQRWLERLTEGVAVGAFALTEPNVGSDAAAVQTTATRRNGSFVIDGCKRWITFGQVADVFLVFVRADGKPTALLVERDAPGLSIRPIRGMLGTRASLLAELQFEACEVPATSMVGGPGFGWAAVGASALDIGRYSVACGSVGIGQACLEASVAHATERVQFGAKLKDHQLVRQMITDMLTNVRAARLLCEDAGCLKDAGDLESGTAIMMAKYFASTMAMKAASDAVQIHGASGCAPDANVQRYFRDAKVMEIIEGSSQIQQITIPERAFQVSAAS